MPSMKLPGARINYEVRGTGEPLLLIRGYGSHLGWWDPDFLSLLEENFQLILYDHRGTGRSIHSEGEYSILTLASDTASLIQKLGFKKVNVFGLSLGGMVAQELAINWPKLIKSLVLGATHCGGKTLVPPTPEVMQTILARAKEGKHEPIDDAWLAITFTPAFLLENPAAVQAYLKRAAHLPTEPEIVSLQAQAAATFDTCDRIPAITAPTWILHGQFDSIVPIGNAFVLQSRIPFSRLLILPGMGHEFTAQNPTYAAWVMANILQFEEILQP
jgi:pimeloyl-ACP methyl ester carboxylesterase